MASKAPKARPDETTKETRRERVPRREGEPCKTPNRSGAYLKHARRMRGLSRADVAGMLDIGFGTLARHEWLGITERCNRKAIEDMCKLYGIDGAAFDQLFVIGHLDGTPYNIDLLSHHWIELAKRLKLKGSEGKRVTLHDLRHTFATSAVTRGGDVASVSANLGHAQVSTTLNMYTSRDTAAQRETNALVANDLDNAQAGEVLPFNKQATGTEG